MATTVLTILGDARGARRALGDVRADHARASAAMGADDRARARERRRAEADEVAGARRELAALQRARQRAARERRAAEERERKGREAAARQEAAAKARSERQEVASRRRAEADKTRDADREARKRARLAADEARQRRREEEGITRAYQQQVQERGRLAQRELNQRRAAEQRAAEQRRAGEQRAGERRGRRAVEAIGATAGAARAFGADVHGQMEGARQRRAALQGQVIDAVSQVGVTDLGEVDRYVEMIRTRALREGMRSEDFAGAIGQAQTEFSALGAMDSLGGAANAGRRAQVFQRAIDTAARGRNLGVDPGEFSRLMGMLGNQGLDQPTQDRLAAWTVGAAQRGAIEPGAVTRDAMGPILQRMQAAMAGAAPADRTRAAEEAYRQAFSEIQVLRGAGESARLSSSAMANWNRSLANPGTQAKMRENVSHIADRDQRQRVQQALFDRDGALRSELRNPLAFTGALMGAGVNDPTQMANLFAGTGAGNAQSMQANFRRMMMGLAGNGGVEKVRAMMDASTAISPERVAALAAMRRGSEQAQLNRNEEARDRALTENTSGLVQLNRTISDFSARNPLASSGMLALGGAAAGVFGAKGLAVGASALTAAGGVFNNARSAITGRDLQGHGLGLGERYLRAQAATLGVLGGVPGMVLNGMMGSRDAGQFVGSPQGQEALVSLPDRIVAAFRGLTVTATVAPHDLEHQAMRNASRRPG